MIKLADTLEPMADFPSAYAKDIAFDDGDTLQEKLDTGSLGGGGVGYKQLSQAEYDALTEDEKLDGREYRTYDTGHIYKLGIEYGKDGVQISDNETVEDKTWSSSKIAEEVTGAIDTINTSLANYSIPLNLYMGIKHYLAIKINIHNMNYSFNMSDRSGNIYEGTFFSYNGSFSIQITKVNNSSTKNGYILGFRQYKVSDSEIYLVVKVSDYNYINGVINTSSILKSNIEILVNDDSTLWDKGTDIVVKELATMDKVSRVYDWTFRKQTYATMEDFLIDMVNRGIIINGASNSVVISFSYSYIAVPEITELNDKGFVNNSMAGGCLYIDGVYSTDTSNQGNRLVVRFEGQEGHFVYLDNSGWGTERHTYRQYATK